jgi:hypothetical protein
MMAPHQRLLLGGLAVAALVVALNLSSAGYRPKELLAHSFFFSDSGAVGRAQELASAEASQGKGVAGVKSLLKRELNQQVKEREYQNRAKEGQRYEKALQAGGLRMDPAAEKTILSAFEHSKRNVASSLAISGKLQKQVTLAGAIKRTSQQPHASRHRWHKPVKADALQVISSDKLRLAKAILDGRMGPTGGIETATHHMIPNPATETAKPAHHYMKPEQSTAKAGPSVTAKKGTTHPASKKAVLKSKTASFKRAMEKQLATRVAKLEKQGIRAVEQHAHAATVHAKTSLKGDFAQKMLDQLNGKTKRMADAAWHDKVKAVTSKDLSKASWPSVKQIEHEDQDLSAVDTTLSSHKKAPTTSSLVVGSSSDATDVAISNPVKTSRESMEKQISEELNTKVEALKHSEFASMVQSFLQPKSDKHAETDLVKVEASSHATDFSRSKLEQALKQRLDNIDTSRVEALYHAGLVKEKFDGAKFQ